MIGEDRALLAALQDSGGAGSVKVVEMPGEPTSEGQPASAQGRTIPVTCETHGGCRGFGNLRVRRHGGDIVLDPHVTGACVIVLD